MIKNLFFEQTKLGNIENIKHQIVLTDKDQFSVSHFQYHLSFLKAQRQKSLDF